MGYSHVYSKILTVPKFLCSATLNMTRIISVVGWGAEVQMQDMLPL